MRGLRRFALAVLALWAGAAGARSLEAIRASGELRICVAGSSAPFYQVNAESFARFLGVRPAVTRLAEWDQQFHDASGTTVKEARYEAARLADGRCDLYPNDLHIADWRQSKMLLVPYYSTRKVVVAHRDLRPLLRTVDDLAGRSAAVQKDTAYDAWLREQNDKRFAAQPIAIVHAPTAESMRRVAARETDFTVAGGESVFKWVRGDLDNLDILFPVDAPVEVGWGVSPRATDLAAALERFFEANARVGSELDRAWQRSYGISLMEYKLHEAAFGTGGLDRRELIAWGLPIGGLLLGILTAMAFWTRRLRRVIAEHRRTEAHLQ
jgi:ABC-type amino acid transport substrate-binding protein